MRKFKSLIYLVILFQAFVSFAGAYRVREGVVTGLGADSWTEIRTPLEAVLIFKDGYAVALRVSNGDPFHSIFVCAAGDNTYYPATGNFGREVKPNETIDMPLVAYQSPNNRITREEITYQYWDNDLDPNDPHAIHPGPNPVSGQAAKLSGDQGGAVEQTNRIGRQTLANRPNAGRPANPADQNLRSLLSSLPVDSTGQFANDSSQNVSAFSDAMSTVRNAMSQFQDAIQQVRSLDLELKQLNQAVLNLPKEIAELQRQKELALDEMRQGAFCRACHRTRSEFEANPDKITLPDGEVVNESWQHHLDANSGGKAIPATPEELAAEAKKYDDQIGPLESQLSQDQQNIILLKNQQNVAMSSVKTDSEECQAQLRAAGHLANREHQQQATEAESLLDKNRKMLSHLDQLEQKARNSTPRDDSFIADCESQKQSLQNETSKMEQKRQFANFQYDQNRREWGQAVKDWESQITDSRDVLGMDISFGWNSIDE